MTNAAAAFLNKTNLRIRERLAHEGIEIPPFGITVRPFDQFQESLREYFTRFSQSRRGQHIPLDEDNFVKSVLANFDNALVVSAPLAGEIGELYVRELPSDESARNVVLMHELGHLVANALNWQRYLSLPDFIITPARSEAHEITKEGFATWFSYTFQDFGGYLITKQGIHDLHHGLDDYLLGFNFFDSVETRFGQSAVFNIMKWSHTLPLEAILNPSTFEPQAFTKPYALAFLRTRDESYLKDIRRAYIQHFMDYFEKHGFFVMTFEETECGKKNGFLMEGKLYDGPIALDFYFGQHYAWINSTDVGGEPYTTKFEGAYIKKMIDERVLGAIKNLRIETVHFGHADAEKPMIMSSHLPHDLFFSHAYITSTPVRNIVGDLWGVRLL